jgi:hypothetical protein
VSKPYSGTTLEMPFHSPLFFDELSSVVRWIDSNGTLVSTYQYDPYGNLTSSGCGLLDGSIEPEEDDGYSFACLRSFQMFSIGQCLAHSVSAAVR